jgi:hypothetical protein
MLFSRPGKEPLSGCHITPFAQEKVDGSTLLGVIAESVPKCTLSGIEEHGARISQRPEPVLERFGRRDLFAIEADVFPAKWVPLRYKHLLDGFPIPAKGSRPGWPFLQPEKLGSRSITG